MVQMQLTHTVPDPVGVRSTRASYRRRVAEKKIEKRVGKRVNSLLVVSFYKLKLACNAARPWPRYGMQRNALKSMNCTTAQNRTSHAITLTAARTPGIVSNINYL